MLRHVDPVVVDPLGLQAVDQRAERHLERGRVQQAIKQLELVVSFIGDPPGRSTVSDEAAGRLGNGATRVIAGLRTA